MRMVSVIQPNDSAGDLLVSEVIFICDRLALVADLLVDQESEGALLIE
jgi:hypothetical protein